MNGFSRDTAQNERVTKTPCGVNIYSLKSPGLHSFCLCIYARGGVIYEDPKDNGISHFVEHIVFRNINMLMNGSLYDTLDDRGLTFTAATYKEFMQFCITGESSKLPLACDIITKLFEPLCPELAKEEFELERDRIRAEIREYDEKASLDYLVKKSVWNGTSLSGMITGTLGSVSKITLSKCENERKKIFSSGNFFFYLTGNYDDGAISYLSDKISGYSFDICEARENVCPIPSDFGKRSSEVLTKDSGYYMIEMCFDMDTERFSKPLRALFYDMMFAGENCRFFRELSENLGYIYSYDAKIEEYRNVGNLSISFEVEHKRLCDSLEACVRLFNGMKTDASGLSRAKVFYTDNACLALDNAEELNWTMAYENYILDERMKSVDDRIMLYDGVTEQQIKELAQNVFVPENLVIGIKGRKKKIDTEKVCDIMQKLG